MCVRADAILGVEGVGSGVEAGVAREEWREREDGLRRSVIQDSLSSYVQVLIPISRSSSPWRVHSIEVDPDTSISIHITSRLWAEG